MTPKEFVERLLNHYGSPEHVIDKKGLRKDYEAALEGTDPGVLQEASDRIVKVHLIRAWPTVGECLERVRDVAEERARNFRHQQHRTGPDYYHRKPTQEERERVDALVKAMTKDWKEREKKLRGRRILDVIYEEYHGAPYPARHAIEAMKKKTDDAA